MAILTPPPHAPDDERAKCRAINNLFTAVEGCIDDHPHPWDAFVCVWTLTRNTGEVALQQIDPIFYLDGKPDSFSVMKRSAAERVALDYLESVEPGREFNTAIIILAHRKDTLDLNARAYFDNDAAPHLITPETWWTVAAALMPDQTFQPAFPQTPPPQQLLPRVGTVLGPTAEILNYILDRLEPQLETYPHPWDALALVFYTTHRNNQLNLSHVMPIFYRDGFAYSDFSFQPDGDVEIAAPGFVHAALNERPPSPVMLAAYLTVRNTDTLTITTASGTKAEELQYSPDSWPTIAKHFNPFSRGAS